MQLLCPSAFFSMPTKRAATNLRTLNHTRAYVQVQAAGGGIHFTTEKTRQASEDDLLKDFRVIANEMLRSGTTLMEAKSGYGLDKETELKMLRVLDRASKDVPVRVLKHTTNPL